MQEVKGLEISTPQIPFEHERRFVPKLDKLPFDFRDYPMSEIFQGYLEDGVGTRVRCESKKGEGHIFTRTVKTGEGVSRREEENEITSDEFNDIWNRISCTLKKFRYFIPYNGFEVQLNIFSGTLEGYIQIEVEFASGDEALLFQPPAWLGPEVTDDKRHRNYSLAKNGAP